MSKVTYNVIYQVCGQVTADIPDDITTREEAVAYLEKNWKNMLSKLQKSHAPENCLA